MIPIAKLEASIDQLQLMLNELRTLVRGVAGKPPRVQTLSDSLDWPIMESPHPRDRTIDPAAETHERCKVCGVGLVAPTEMELWTRKEAPHG